MLTFSRLTRIAPFCLALATGGCGYIAVPPDPIRYVTSPADVASCRRLGAVGYTRTDGVGPYRFSDLTTPVLSYPRPGDTAHPIPSGEIVGPNFAVTLEVMRDAALSLGASDLLLSRRIYHDWSYVAGTAYRCSR
ncbi:hypothetical protein [Enterovirga sp.]|uniref:hypothetical protein n=1 Tax=Enterovirga sp. TaxID=2026350 RepID=UPI002CF491BE|nr:hypothetical protein [Enterovirga sp.]HMO29603.1 hypothetical protein [Enterovirga sp.]